MYFPVIFLVVVARSVAFRTDVCVKEHEEFSLCGWRCPPTCVNMRLLRKPGVYCPYRWECQVGCRCSAGYIRDEYSKHCVNVTDCPLFAVAVNFARAHVAFLGGPNHLHPVHGLYVKPSSDGTTGDLYVAATEDSAVKSQWLTDQPVNFLPHQVAYTSSHPDEAVVTNQKRSIITSPAIKYAYAMPVAASDGSAANAAPAAVQYPYAIPAAAPVAATVAATEGSENTEAAASPALPYYQYPFHHFYYSQMMSAFANALNNAATTSKEGSGEEGTATATTTAVPQAPVWPYSYPVQYVMVDPAAWANAQAASTAQTTSTTEASTVAASNENS